MTVELIGGTAAHWRAGLAASARLLAAALLLTVLAACSSGGGGGGLGGLFRDSGGSDPQATAPAPVPEAPAATIKVALLLPLTAEGQTAGIANAMKQAAELALIDSGNPGLTLLTKDTRGSASGAQAAANVALNEGASLILGPLLAAEVQTVGPLARQRSVPVIAFSSVASTAGQGVYLMSFLPEEEVSNLIRHAGGAGITNIAALIPQNAYGTTAEGALNRSVLSNGARVVAIDRFPRTATGVTAAAQAMAGRILNASDGIEALFVPEGGELLAAAGRGLAGAGVQPGAVRMFGTGLWDDPATSRTPLIEGGWYAGVSPELVTRFDQRYRQTYGAAPPRIASLAYDAVSLAVIVARQAQGARVSTQSITNPDGFKGVNGLFRFRPNGLIERGLAILEVSAAGPRVIAPAPARFGGGS